MLTPGALYAQRPADTFAALQHVVAAGDTVTVSDASGAAAKRAIASLAQTWLVLRLGGG